MIKYRINLCPEERTELLAKVQKGKATVKTVQKAQVLLASDETVERQSETDIAATYYLSTRSVERIRKDFCERGMAVFTPKQRQPRSDKKLTGELEAHLIAIACSEPPAGESRWWFTTGNSNQVCFYFPRYLFITAGLAFGGGKNGHSPFTELFADAFHAANRQMVGGRDGRFALTFHGIVTGQQDLGFLNRFCRGCAFLHFG